jgi:hypothetical protein
MLMRRGRSLANFGRFAAADLYSIDRSGVLT